MHILFYTYIHVLVIQKKTYISFNRHCGDCSLYWTAGRFSYFIDAPTCFDNIQNQGEEGIDCGGPCKMLCQAGFAPPQELWATSSLVVSNVYNLLAYVSNSNPGVAAPSISYDFRLYDANGILIGKRTGETPVPATAHFAIFEPAVGTNTQVPAKTFFQFTSAPDWQNAATSSYFSVTYSNLNISSTTSKLDVSVANSSANQKNNTDITAILYDNRGNVVTFSKSVIPLIAALGNANVSFTWPYSISTTVARKEFLFQDNSSF